MKYNNKAPPHSPHFSWPFLFHCWRQRLWQFIFLCINEFFLSYFLKHLWLFFLNKLAWRRSNLWHQQSFSEQSLKAKKKSPFAHWKMISLILHEIATLLTRCIIPREKLTIKQNFKHGQNLFNIQRRRKFFKKLRWIFVQDALVFQLSLFMQFSGVNKILENSDKSQSLPITK